MKLEHLSASRIKTFETCQLKYHAVYELSVKETPHPLTNVGSSLHFMMEHATLAYMSGTGSTNPLDYKVAACQEFSVEVEYYPLIDELVAKAIGWGYFRNIDRIKGVELEVAFNLNDNTEVTGFIDRLDVFDQTADIKDLKTQKNAFEPEELSLNWQARIYNIAVRKKFLQVVDKLCVSFWVLRHRVQKVWLTAEDAVRDCLALVDKAREIRSCSNPQPSPSGLCQFCGYREQCPQPSLKKMFKKKGRP